jgi:hypothetical protein
MRKQRTAKRGTADQTLKAERAIPDSVLQIAPRDDRHQPGAMIP